MRKFTDGELQVLDFIMVSLMRGTHPTMVLRHKEFASMVKKINEEKEKRKEKAKIENNETLRQLLVRSERWTELVGDLDIVAMARLPTLNVAGWSGAIRKHVIAWAEGKDVEVPAVFKEYIEAVKQNVAERN